jgi:hypothetical protein
MASRRKVTFFCGWFRPAAGGAWQRLVEGPVRAEVVDQVVKLMKTRAGDSLVLPNNIPPPAMSAPPKGEGKK